MKPGLYEQIINKQMNEELQSVPEECRHQEKVDSAEASRVLATYAAELMKRKMDAIYEASGDQALSDQIAYINKVIGAMDVETEEELQIERPGEQLLNLLSEKDEQRLLGRKRNRGMHLVSISGRAASARAEGEGCAAPGNLDGVQQSVYGCRPRATDADGAEEGDRLRGSDRYARVLHQVERTPRAAGGAPKLHYAWRPASRHLHLVHGCNGREGSRGTEQTAKQRD